MMTLKNKIFVGYWQRPLFQGLLGINFLLFCTWVGLKFYNVQTHTTVQRLSSFHQEHHQQQRLLYILKKGPKNPAPPLSSKNLKKEVKKIAKQHAIELQEATTLSPPSPRLLQLGLKSTALLEEDCFAFIAALQQVPGFLGFKELRLKRNFSDAQLLASLSTSSRSFAPYNLHLTLLWGIHTGGDVS